MEYMVRPPSVGARVHGDLTLARGAAYAAVHPRAVEFHSVIAVRIDSDHATLAPGVPELLMDYRAHGLGQRHLLVAHHGADIVSDHLPDIELALAGARHRAGLVRVGAGPDDRRIADAPVELIGDAAGGSGRGEMALGVEGHGADRAHALRSAAGPDRQWPRGRACGGSPLVVLELAQALRGYEVALRHERRALLERELLGAGAGEHHVGGFIHDEARQIDRVLDVVDARHGTGPRSRAIHDGRIELAEAVVVE